MFAYVEADDSIADPLPRGILAHGSAIVFDLTALNDNINDWFASDSTVTVTVVPEPGSLALLGVGGLALIRRRR